MIIITATKFREIGTAMFRNTKWYGAMGKLIGTSRYMAWRIATGRTNLKPARRATLALAMRTQAADLLRLAEEIDPGSKLQHSVVKTPSK